MHLLEILFNWAMTPKDLYCERLLPGIWGEPANVLSSLIFLVPVYIAFKCRNKFFGWLTSGVFTASTAYHLFANNLTYVLDVGLIIATIVIYYVFFFISVGVKKPLAIAGMLAYLLFVFMSLQALPIEYSYSGVLPLFGGQLTILFSRKLYANCLQVLIGLGAFCFALAARFFDSLVCASFPHGTHFLWHAFSALSLAALLLCLAYKPKTELPNIIK